MELRGGLILLEGSVRGGGDVGCLMIGWLLIAMLEI